MLGTGCFRATALGKDVMYMVLQGYCARTQCDLQGVAGDIVLREGVMYRVLYGY